MFAAIAYSTQGNDVLIPAIALLIVGLLFAYGSKFHYLEVVKDKPESIKFSRLYHRLGSAMGR